MGGRSDDASTNGGQQERHQHHQIKNDKHRSLSIVRPPGGCSAGAAAAMCSVFRGGVEREICAAWSHVKIEGAATLLDPSMPGTASHEAERLRVDLLLGLTILTMQHRLT